LRPSHLVEAIRGRERLVVVFWYYFVLGELGLVLLLVAASTAVPMVRAPLLMGVLTVAFAVPLVAYHLWVMVSLWTCAFNVRLRFWGYLARGYVAILGIGSVLEARDALSWLTRNAA